MLDKRLTSFDAGDPDHVEILARLQEQIDRRLIDCWAAHLDTYEGRMMIWELLDNSCPMFHSLSGLSDQAIREASGRRDVGLEIFAYVMTANPEAYLVMTREAEQRTREAQRLFDEALENLDE